MGVVLPRRPASAACQHATVTTSRPITPEACRARLDTRRRSSQDTAGLAHSNSTVAVRVVLAASSFRVAPTTVDAGNASCVAEASPALIDHPEKASTRIPAFVVARPSAIRLPSLWSPRGSQEARPRRRQWSPQGPRQLVAVCQIHLGRSPSTSGPGPVKEMAPFFLTRWLDSR